MCLSMCCSSYRRVETVSITEAEGYPPLLFAAVKSGNELAVRGLLDNGVAPTAKFRGRYTILYRHKTTFVVVT